MENVKEVLYTIVALVILVFIIYALVGLIWPRVFPKFMRGWKRWVNALVCFGVFAGLIAVSSAVMPEAMRLEMEAEQAERDRVRAAENAEREREKAQREAQKERDRLERRQRADRILAERDKSGQNCFSAWDGKSDKLVSATKGRLRDPSTFRHIETRTMPLNENGKIETAMKFSVVNAYGNRVEGVSLAAISPSSCSVNLVKVLID